MAIEMFFWSNLARLFQLQFFVESTSGTLHQ